MIVEINSLTTIAQGTQRTQTEAGDSVIRIPNTMLPVVELIEPLTLSPLSNVINTSSFCLSRYISRNNQAAVVTSLCILGRGYWELNWTWILRQTLAAPVTFNTNGYVLQATSPIGGVSFNFSSLLPIQSGEYQSINSVTFLLRENMEVSVGLPLTGAADFIETNVHLMAKKLL